MKSHKTIAMLPILLGLAIFSGISQCSLAQSNNQRWYQVELIAFARVNSDTQEHWPTNIKLGYPINWVELKDPNKSLDNSTAGSATTDNQSETAENQTIDLLRTPFYFLPESDKKLRNHAAALKRNARYRVLFHQAWRQFIGDQKRAPALVITGGSMFGNHYELEGSITLSVAQYLQLQTRLWFSEFEINYGQAPGEWPQLPMTPNKLREELLAADNQQVELSEATSNYDQWSSMNTPTAEMTLSNLRESHLTKRIVTMEQDRRMRSNELHYIDHPLFGLIIQITPYSLPPQPATR